MVKTMELLKKQSENHTKIKITNVNITNTTRTLLTLETSRHKANTRQYEHTYQYTNNDYTFFTNHKAILHTNYTIKAKIPLTMYQYNVYK